MSNEQETQIKPLIQCSVSHCPLCKYSLKDLAADQPCPECGCVIDRDLLTSPEMIDAVGLTKTLCAFGIIGWMVFAFGYWAYNMVLIAVMNSYYPGTFGTNDTAGVWCKTAFVIAPVALCCSWHRHARQRIYQFALKREPCIAKTPKRVVFYSAPGILLGFLGGIGILMLLSSA